MGLGVFTPALLIISGLCGLALLISALNFVSIGGVKARMVTQNQQELFGQRLLAALGTKLEAAAEKNRESIESLREDYRTHVVEVAEVKATHNATMRQVDQVLASNNQLHRLLVERLINIASGRRNEHAPEEMPPHP